MLAPGRRALAFGVGRERLPGHPRLAAGVAVVATDQAADTAGDWATVGQHAAALEELRCDEVCPPARFERLVSFRAVDMTDIPDDLTGFDLLWSSCAFEHLGSASAGAEFVLREWTVSEQAGSQSIRPNYGWTAGRDLELDGTVLYSIATLRRLVARLRLRGHRVLANFHVPLEAPPDRFVDLPPYPHEPSHLKLQFGGADYVVVRDDRQTAARPLTEISWSGRPGAIPQEIAPGLSRLPRLGEGTRGVAGFNSAWGDRPWGGIAAEHQLGVR